MIDFEKYKLLLVFLVFEIMKLVTTLSLLPGLIAGFFFPQKAKR